MKTVIDSLKAEVANDKCQIVELTNRVTELEKDKVNKDARVKVLEKANKDVCDRLDQMERKSVELEGRVHDVEQYTRKDDLIFTGVKIKKSYARVAAQNEVTNNENAPETELNSVEQQVIDFLKNKNIELDKSEISACHTLGKKRDDDTQNVIVRLVNRNSKTRLLSNGIRLKGTNVFMNEHLTKKNAQLSKMARELKKDGKLKSTWTRNCVVFVRTNGASPEDEKIKLVKEKDDLLQFT